MRYPFLQNQCCCVKRWWIFSLSKLAHNFSISRSEPVGNILSASIYNYPVYRYTPRAGVSHILRPMKRIVILAQFAENTTLWTSSFSSAVAFRSLSCDLTRMKAKNQSKQDPGNSLPSPQQQHRTKSQTTTSSSNSREAV